MITAESIQRPPSTSCPSLISIFLESNPSQKYPLTHLGEGFGRHGLRIYSARLCLCLAVLRDSMQLALGGVNSSFFFGHLSDSLLVASILVMLMALE